MVGPFDEFDERWYMAIGTFIALMLAGQMLIPHISVLYGSTFLSYIRCLDRGCKTNKAITKQVIQKKYEELYTGDEFFIQFRLA